MSDTTKKPAVKRIYRVMKIGEKARLVNAVSPFAAILHVHKTDVAVPSQHELAALLTSGVKVEEIES